MTEQMDGQVSLFAHDTWSGKTCPERSAATTGKTLPQSLKKRSGSSSRKPPLFLCLKKDGLQADAWWETDGALLGEYSTHSFGECPRDGVESYLSQILEDSPHRKYYLSAKACQGTLYRAARRGKDLPEALKAALLMQSESGGGCDGGGKGALVQEEMSGTLGCNNDQTIFCLNDQSGNVMGISQDVSGTLRAQEHGHQPTILDMSHACDVVRECGDVCPSLQARMGTGGNQVPLTFHQKRFGSYDRDNVAGTCQARDGKDGTANLVCAVDCRNGTENPETNGTLQAKSTGGQSLNLNNVVREAMTVRRLTPLECERLQGFPSRKEIDIREMTKDEYIAWNLQCGNIIADTERGKVFAMRGPGGIRLDKPKELVGSVVNGYKVVSIRNGTTKLQCKMHRIIWIAAKGVVPAGYCIDHINNDKQDNRLSNLQLLTPVENSHKAKNDGLYKTGEDNKATKISPELYDEIAYLYATDDFTMRELAEVYGISKSRISQIVREVGWTDIGNWQDSNGKKRQTTDSARYKALGNSIALPPWKWVLKRLCAQYERDATMASLFDGIGGFPLIWEQLNGKGSCLWASEIEEFPMAVTRKHFG